MMELELARQLPPEQALAEASRLHDSAVARQRPGLQLHAAALAAQAARAAGLAVQAAQFSTTAQALLQRCAPFDMSGSEARALLAAATSAA
jgi:hypothetical protein